MVACNRARRKANADSMRAGKEDGGSDTAVSMYVLFRDGIKKIASNVYMSKRDASVFNAGGVDVANRENEEKNLNEVRQIVAEMCCLCIFRSIL